MTTDEIGCMLRTRTIETGLRIRRTDPIPPLPYDVSHALAHTNGHQHICEHERCIELPLVLVCDAFLSPDPEIMEHAPYSIESREPFTPYWLGGVRVIHDWVPYPEAPFRAVTPIEAACIFAQYPHLGSVKAHLNWPGWGHSSIQVYRRPNMRQVVFSPFHHWGYNHHAAFCRYTVGFQGFGTREVVFSSAPTTPPQPASATGATIPSVPPSPPQETPKEAKMKKRDTGKKRKRLRK